jgi:hypothetical protein
MSKWLGVKLQKNCLKFCCAAVCFDMSANIEAVINLVPSQLKHSWSCRCDPIP